MGLIVVLTVIIFFAYARREKAVSGYVLDCGTNDSIVNAEVSVNQVGWGFENGQPVWDKSYVTNVRSDSRGYFRIAFDVGSSAHLTALKDGYLTAEQWEYPGDSIAIKMLKGDDTSERTYNCKRSSECLSCRKEDSVEVCKSALILHE